MNELNENISPKLSSIIIQQLKQKNISTVVEFLIEDSEKLMRITGLPFKDVCEIKQYVSTIYGSKEKTAFDILVAEEQHIMQTRIISLDSLMNGGFFPGQIYELCGVSASGKTQCCLTLAANASSNSNTITRYIDTKSDFCGSRLEEILLTKRYSQQIVDDIMDRVKVSSIRSPRQLLSVLRFLKSGLAQENEHLRTRLIIIDCLPAVIFKFSKEHDTTYVLNQVASVCRYLAKEFYLTIVTVNLVIYWNSNIANVAPDMNPALGKYWSRVPNTRLLIEKLDSVRRKFTVWKSCQLEENTSCILTLDSSGIS